MAFGDAGEPKVGRCTGHDPPQLRAAGDHPWDRAPRRPQQSPCPTSPNNLRIFPDSPNPLPGHLPRLHLLANVPYR